MTALIIHGHFYQPPRENPWTGTIDPEPSAHPFHDWNERIHAECYQPNSAVRILNPKTDQELIVNNYANVSFDFGPTLLSWLERQHPETYARILAADVESSAKHNGHGNAMAQAYNHTILPLANERDQRTQIRWGLADFSHRFGRTAEGMWLAETAANDEVLGNLIDEGVRFVILAPQQAERFRSRTDIPVCPDLSEPPASAGGVATELSEPPASAGGVATELSEPPASAGGVATELSEPPALAGGPTFDFSPTSAGGVTVRTSLGENGWHDVSGGRIDTGIAYRYFHRDGSGRSIAVFFYDQDLAHGIAFEQTLSSSSSLVNRLAHAATKNGRAGSLVNVATDGESYGHHHKFGDLCLAYALEIDAPDRGFWITNYGEYLDQHPPVMEVEIIHGSEGEGSSWSCIHGVSRWIRDCGCQTGGEAGWNQTWRQPLRKALDYLRDEAVKHFEATRGELFVDPWAARDAAISLVLNEQKSREEFLRTFAPRELSRDESRRALGFLELQRNALLMYTSCGWFFSDLAGIEPIQILKYAARAINLINQLGLPSPRKQFLEILSEARSNRVELGNGADIYRRLVEPVQFAPVDDELLVT